MKKNLIRFSEILIGISLLSIIFLHITTVLAFTDPTIKLAVSSRGDYQSIHVQGTVTSNIAQPTTLDVYYGETLDTMNIRAQVPLYTGFLKALDATPVDYTLAGLKENQPYYLMVVNSANPSVVYYGPVKVGTLTQELGFGNSKELSVNVSISPSGPEEVSITGTVISPVAAHVGLDLLYGDFTNGSGNPNEVNMQATPSLFDADVIAATATKIAYKFKTKPDSYYYFVVVNKADHTKKYVGPIQVHTPPKTVIGYGVEYKPSPFFSVSVSTDTSVQPSKDTYGTAYLKGTVSVMKAITPNLKLVWGEKESEMNFVSESIFNRPLNTGDTADFTYKVSGLEKGKTYYYKVIDSATTSRAYTSTQTFTGLDGDSQSTTSTTTPVFNPIEVKQEFKDGLVPCLGDLSDPCDFNDLIQLGNNIIKFAIRLAFPVFAVIFAYAGWLYLSAGASGGEANEKAKELFKKAIIGLLIVLGSWLLVSSLLDWLLASNFKGANNGQVIDNLNK